LIPDIYTLTQMIYACTVMNDISNPAVCWGGVFYSFFYPVVTLWFYDNPNDLHWGRGPSHI